MVYQLKRQMETFVFNNYEELSVATAHYIFNASIKAKNPFTIALSGGSTPKRLYEILASSPFAENINWKKIFIFFVDERYVPHTNAESNYKMISDALLSKIKIPKKNILKIDTRVTPAKDALDYERRIKSILKGKGVDLMLLGIGSDGHTASLFPKYTLLNETKKLVKEEFIQEKKQYRISCTLPFINKASQIVFLVSGKDKATVYKEIKKKPNKSVPASLVESKQPIFWFVDKDVVSI